MRPDPDFVEFVRIQAEWFRAHKRLSRIFEEGKIPNNVLPLRRREMNITDLATIEDIRVVQVDKFVCAVATDTFFDWSKKIKRAETATPKFLEAAGAFVVIYSPTNLPVVGKGETKLLKEIETLRR